MTSESTFNRENKRFKIAETYFKLDIKFNEKTNSEIEFILKSVVERKILDFKYNEKIVYEIYFDKGSTKAKVAFFAFLNGLIFYADLKQSIKTIYEDVRYLSEQVIETSKMDSPVINNNILRTEKRAGLIGKLKRVLERVEYLQNNLNNIGNNQTQQELLELHQEIANLLQLLDDIDRQSFLAALPKNLTDNLPEPKQNEVEHLYTLYALKPKEYYEE